MRKGEIWQDPCDQRMDSGDGHYSLKVCHLLWVSGGVTGCDSCLTAVCNHSFCPTSEAVFLHCTLGLCTSDVYCICIAQDRSHAKTQWAATGLEKQQFFKSKLSGGQEVARKRCLARQLGGYVMAWMRSGCWSCWTWGWASYNTAPVRGFPGLCLQSESSSLPS